MRVLFFTYVLTIVFFAGCTSAESEEPAEVYRNLAPDVAYVGKEACQACHPDKFETFTKAQMGRSFKPALVQHSAARWENVEPVYDPHNDLYYRAFHRGEELFIMEYRLSDGDTVHKRIEQIDYIVGSGQHTNSHIMDVNGYLYQMPMTWYAQDGKWDLPPKFDDGNNYRFSRPITQPCLACHNAVSDFEETSENRFAAVPHGIDCERCHGPGELHVEEKRAGKIVDVTKEIDYTIVNPAKLPLDRQFDVCQRCHMQGATVFKDGKTPFDFRPGMKLTDVMNVFWPRYSDSTLNFIMASHPDRLKMSECFIESHREGSGFEPMTCTSCHDPHLPIEALGADHYRTVCQSCHEPADSHAEAAALGGISRTSSSASKVRGGASAGASAGECAAPQSLRLSKEDDCAACHMPVSGSIDIPHVRVTDHYIRTPNKLAPDEVDRQQSFVGLASLIEKNTTEREMADGYMAYYEEISNVPYFLDSAEVRLNRALEDEPFERVAPSLVRLRYLQTDYDAIVRLSRRLNRSEVEDAWTLYRIGEAYSKTGDPAAAISYLEDAVRRSPTHLRFLNRLGMEYVTAEQLDKGIEIFDRVLAKNPSFGEAYNNRGFARAMAGDFDGGEADLRKAVDLDPDAYQAIANLASLYLNSGRPEMARPYARRLLESDPTNRNYQQLWEHVR